MIGSFGLDDVQVIAEDIVQSKLAFIYCFISCIIVTVIYSFIVYYATGLIVWICIIATGVGFCVISYSLQNYYTIKYGPDSILFKSGALVKTYEDEGFLSLVYIFYAITAAYFMLICCLFNNIAVSVAVLKTSSVIMIRNFRVLLLPFCSSIILFSWAIFWFYGVLHLLSTG
jgi:hypothetical protein